MCKHSSSGYPTPFQPAPTPTRTQKWTPIIFSSLLPAGPDTPGAEPGAAPADTAPGLDAAESPEQTPPAPLQPHPRGSWQGDAAPPAPHQPMADGHQNLELPGAGSSAKTSTTWAGAGGEAIEGAVSRGAPSPHHPSGMEKLTREHQTRHGTHSGTPTALRGRRGCKDSQPGRRGCRLVPSHPCWHNGGTCHPVPSQPCPPERSCSSPSTRLPALLV